MSDKPGPLKHISESLPLKTESICGLCFYTFDFTFVSYPAIKQSRLFRISDQSYSWFITPQTVKSENFISNEYIFFHVVPRNIKQQRLRKSHVLGPLETALLDVPIHKHILRPNIQPGFILLISSGLSLYYSGFLINMSCNTKSSLIEV